MDEGAFIVNGADEMMASPWSDLPWVQLGRPKDSAVLRWLERSCWDRGFNYDASLIGGSQWYPPRKGTKRKHGELPPAAALRVRGFSLDHERVSLGYGLGAYARAKEALQGWKQFQLGWAEVDPTTPQEKLQNVGVRAQFGPAWSVNPTRIVYVDSSSMWEYSFAYGTLEGHLLAGEERFKVEIDEEGQVWYDVLSFAKPKGALGTLAYPVVRTLQKKFQAESMEAMVCAERGEPYPKPPPPT